jgi:hypothetical protein
MELREIKPIPKLAVWLGNDEQAISMEVTLIYNQEKH